MKRSRLSELAVFFLGVVVAALFISAAPARAALSITTGQSGGTGFGTTTAGNIGNCLSVAGVSPLTYTFSGCAGGTGAAFSFTPTSYGNATSTTLGFLNGFLSTASSTIVGNATTTGTFFTGISSSTSLFGANLTTCNSGNVLTWSAGKFGCAADATGSGVWPFTPTSYGQSTTSVIGFLGGLFTNGSTTITGIGSGLLGANNGLLYGFASSSLFGYTPASNAITLTINGTSNQITSSVGAQNLTTDRTVTLSLPQALQFPLSFTSTYGTTTYASSTALSATSLYSSTLSSGNCVQASTNGLLTTTGSACGAGSGLTGYDAWTHPALGQSATTSLMLFYGNASTTIFTATSSTYLASVNGTVAIGATSTPGSILSIQNVANFVASAISTIYNGLHVLVELVIPTTTSTTVANTGDIAINTTVASSSVEFNNGSAYSLYPDGFGGLPFASSTLAYMGAFGSAGTTTILMANPPRKTTLMSFYCKTDTGTATVQFGTGTASTTSVCTTSGVANATTVSFGQYANVFIGIGDTTGSPNMITASPQIRQTE